MWMSASAKVWWMRAAKSAVVSGAGSDIVLLLFDRSAWHTFGGTSARRVPFGRRWTRGQRMTDRNGRERGYEERSGGLSRGAPPPRGRPVAIPAVPEPHRYAMADLERETGLDARTIRYYITRGLLQPAHGRGPSATYDLGHLLRLRMIQLLKNDRLPLDDIKTRLAELTD